jgi:hypothetical protein
MTPEAQFRQWFVDSMKPLRDDGHSGFIFMLTAFPLLERYLRRKSRVPDGGKLTADFFTTLSQLFPEIGDRSADFWKCYRNGLLHQGTLSSNYYNERRREWIQLPNTAISGHDPRPAYYIPEEDQFFANPIVFFDRVVEAILADFSTYNIDESYPLPAVYEPAQFHPYTVPTIGLFTGTGYWRVDADDDFDFNSHNDPN